MQIKGYVTKLEGRVTIS